MTDRKILFAAASSAVLAAFATIASAQTGGSATLDVRGKPCAGVLDSAKNCLDPSITKNSPDRPYRGEAYDEKQLESAYSGGQPQIPTKLALGGLGIAFASILMMVAVVVVIVLLVKVVFF